MCLENGLSVIEPKRFSGRAKRTEYTERPRTRDEIRRAIDDCLAKKPKDMDSLLKLLREMGYEIKQGKYISVRKSEQNKFIRFRSLGEGYTEQDLENLLSGKNSKKIDMLVDIQAVIAKGRVPDTSAVPRSII